MSDVLTVYQGTQTFLDLTEQFVYRPIMALEGPLRQVALAQHLANADLFPFPRVEQLTWAELCSPRAARAAAARLQAQYGGQVMQTHLGNSAIRMIMLKHFLQVPMVAMLAGTGVRAHAQWPHTGALYRYMFNAVEHVTAVSADLRDCAIERGCPADRITVVPIGVDPAEFSEVDRADRAGRPLHILMVGRLLPVKGHDYAIKALAGLPDDAPAWRATIIGAGLLRVQLQKRIDDCGLTDRVELVGVQPIVQVRQAMADADIFLHPSVTIDDGSREGCPTVIIEAQCRGLPLVATDSGGAREIMRDGQTGLLVPERDEQAMTHALLSVLNNKGMRLSMGHAAAEFVRANLTLARQADGYLEVIQSLAERYPPGTAELRRVPPGPPLPALMRAAWREGWVGADIAQPGLPVDACFRTWSPWRWNMRRRLRKVLYPAVCRFMGRGYRDPSGRDDADWESLRESGFPDLLKGAPHD